MQQGEPSITEPLPRTASVRDDVQYWNNDVTLVPLQRLEVGLPDQEPALPPDMLEKFQQKREEDERWPVAQGKTNIASSTDTPHRDLADVPPSIHIAQTETPTPSPNTDALSAPSIRPPASQSLVQGTRVGTGLCPGVFGVNGVGGIRDGTCKKYEDFVTNIARDPQWDFQHNNVINLRHQSSADWYTELLSPKAIDIFQPLLSNKSSIERESQMKVLARQNQGDGDSAISTGSSSLVVWFERDMAGIDRGSVVSDMLFSDVDTHQFFHEGSDDREPTETASCPTSLSDFLVKVENSQVWLDVPHQSSQKLLTPHSSFLEKFPSFNNVNLVDLVNPSREMIQDLAEGLKKDVVKAFISVITTREYTMEKQIRFVERFLEGHRYERYRVSRRFSDEVINVSRYPIATTRKWEEFVIAVSEELPSGMLPLTQCLSKNDEMRFIYHVIGIYSQMNRRTRGRESPHSPFKVPSVPPGDTTALHRILTVLTRKSRNSLSKPAGATVNPNPEPLPTAQNPTTARKGPRPMPNREGRWENHSPPQPVEMEPQDWSSCPRPAGKSGRVNKGPSASTAIAC